MVSNRSSISPCCAAGVTRRNSATRSRDVAYGGPWKRQRATNGGERIVDRGLADRVLQRVQRQRPLLVVHVVGAVGTQQRLLALLLGPAPGEVAVELVLEEPPHLRVAVLLLQHHQRRVLGEALGDELGALDVRRHHLVRPPLVRDLVRGDEVRIVDVRGVAVVDLGGEADGLVEGHRVGKRRGEAAAAPEARELDDAHDPVLVGPEVRGEVRRASP